MTNATDIIRSLDADDIAARLAELDAERRALMTLLRAARQRKRQTATPPDVDAEGTADA
ncbi:MAG TPA: hypothetical protein QF564_20740 [Pirellulaceae bacterium]|nr:hypothetical protein [Pirellulaceae bacterium]